MIPAVARALSQLGLGPVYDALKALEAAISKQGGGGGGGSFAPLTTLLFVDQGYVGGGSDGSIAKPFTTITAALASIPGVPTRLKRYGIFLAPGIYPENVALRPWAFLIGQNAFITRLTGIFSLPTALWNPASVDPNETDVRSGFQSVTITAPQTYDFNVGPHAGSAFNGSNEGKLLFTDTITNSLQSLIAFSLINQAQFRHAQIFAGLSQQGMQVQLEESAVTGTGPITIADTAGVPAVFTAFGGGTNGDVSVTSAFGGANVDLVGFAVPGNLTLTGGLTRYVSSPPGIPGSVTLAGGAPPPLPTNDGFSVAYKTPPVSPWTAPDPATVNEAITRLAVVVKALNGGVGP
jgi:hypothetical protein